MGRLFSQNPEAEERNGLSHVKEWKWESKQQPPGLKCTRTQKTYPNSRGKRLTYTPNMRLALIPRIEWCLINSHSQRKKYGRAPFSLLLPCAHSPGVINSPEGVCRPVDQIMQRPADPPISRDQKIDIFIYTLSSFGGEAKNLPVEIFSVRVPIEARTMAHSGKLAYWWRCLHRLIMQTSLVVQCRQVPELKKAALYKRGWGASVLVRRCKHLPFYHTADNPLCSSHLWSERSNCWRRSRSCLYGPRNSFGRWSWLHKLNFICFVHCMLDKINKRGQI